LRSRIAKYLIESLRAKLFEQVLELLGRLRLVLLAELGPKWEYLLLEGDELVICRHEDGLLVSILGLQEAWDLFFWQVCHAMRLFNAAVCRD